MISLFADSAGNIFVVFRENHELYRLTLTIHNVVEHEILNNHRTEAEGHHGHALQEGSELRDEETAANDKEIYEDEDGT